MHPSGAVPTSRNAALAATASALLVASGSSASLLASADFASCGDRALAGQNGTTLLDFDILLSVSSAGASPS